MIYYLKRYDISLLPKNFFKGGSFYNKGRGGDREGGGGEEEEEEEEEEEKEEEEEAKERKSKIYD